VDRNLVYPGAIPLDTDILSLNRNTMVALGFLTQACLGTNTVVDGLACTPTSPASLGVQIGPGSIGQLSVVDSSAYGSLAADTGDALVKMGINLTAQTLTLQPQLSSGQSITYLIQATLSEIDVDPLVLAYYNAANPSQPFSGANGNNVAQNTLRKQVVELLAKPGAPATTGSQALPPVDNGWVGLYSVTIGYGQLAVTASNIAVWPLAPFINFKLPQLRPGFASGVQTFTTPGEFTFTVPVGVTQVEAEVWGAGSGSFASVSGVPSGGAGGGGYARGRVTSLTAGTLISVVVGAGGSAGTGSANPTTGGSSSLGAISATGGGLNPQANASSPQNGAPGGIGVGGDFNAAGSAGQAGISNVGGLGGAAPLGGSQNSGTAGNGGIFPGGGASGAGTGPAGNQANPGGSGAHGPTASRPATTTELHPIRPAGYLVLTPLHSLAPPALTGVAA
jgi:hypothetical protein